MSTFRSARIARRGASVAVAIAVTWLGVTAGRPYFHGFTLVVRAADVQGVVRGVANLNTVAVAERVVRTGPERTSTRARVYSPIAPSRHTVLLVAGLHPAGIDEPRLIGLATKLAQANVTVVTPEIPELTRFEITPVLTDRIEAAAAWLAADPELAPSGRIGLMGISFSGGLAVVAAGRPSLRDRLLYVFSYGGHDDLRRVLEYSCAGTSLRARPASRHRGALPPAPPPHDYGLAVILLNVAEHVVPPEQVEALRDAVRRFLFASYIDRFDKRHAEEEFAALRDLERTLPDPAATLLEYVNTRNVERLGPRLLPFAGPYVGRSALSPARSPRPHAPVFLLHGKEDNVIPAAESRRLADRLRGIVPVRVLITGLLSHAEADQPARAIDVMRIAGFWGDLLAQ